MSAIIGLIITILIVAITDYYTAKRFRPVYSLPKLRVRAMPQILLWDCPLAWKPLLPIILISCGILASFYFAGLYGIAVSAMSMLSVAGIIIAIDSFGPITDNAGGIAEMTNQPEGVRRVTDSLTLSVQPLPKVMPLFRRV